MKYKIIKPHFKTHKRNGHPSYIYADNGTEYKYIGITHAYKTHKLNNKKLKFNPNSKDMRISYVRGFSTHDIKNNFKKKKLSGYKIHKADKRMISKIKKNYKK